MASFVDTVKDIAVEISATIDTVIDEIDSITDSVLSFVASLTSIIVSTVKTLTDNPTLVELAYVLMLISPLVGLLASVVKRL